MRDHTSDAMWLGPSFPLDTSVLSPDGGDDAHWALLSIPNWDWAIAEETEKQYSQFLNI